MSHYDIAPVNGNPRNSEGAFCPTDGKELLFAYSAFRGDSFFDHACADIKLIRSSDGGITWSAPVLVARPEDYGAMNIMSVSMLRMQNGDIGLFYLVRMDWLDMYAVLQRSSDQGKTWSAPKRCTPRKGYYVLNNDRVVRTSSGRIILPVADHENKRTSDGGVRFAPAKAVFFYSDDDGNTWNEAPAKLSLHYPACRSGLQEPGVIETAPGRLYGWARTDLGRQYEFCSDDNGLHWSQAQPSWFTSPLSPLSMKKLADGRFIAIWNPVPANNIKIVNRATGDRTPLVYAFSEDQGKTWNAPVTIEDETDRGYCYTAIHQIGNHLLLAYCAGSEQDMGGCLNRLRIRLLPLDSASY
jgi:Neuraminidase (sialidase)